MKDGRLTLYFGSEDRKVMQDILSRYVGADMRFRDSEAEFIRYCIRFTIENDKSLGNGKKQ